MGPYRVCSLGVDSEPVGAAGDLYVVTVGCHIVVGALPSHLASDGSEVLLVESKLTGAMAYKDPSGDAFRAVDGELAGTSKDTQRDRARRVRQPKNALARAALYLEGTELQLVEIGVEVRGATANLYLPGNGSVEQDLVRTLVPAQRWEAASP